MFVFVFVFVCGLATAGDRIGKYPIILADQSDNPGGGAPSDNTEILQLFLDRNLEDAVVLHIRDPETAQVPMFAPVFVF